MYPIRDFIKKLFLNDYFILVIIILNSVVIYAQISGVVNVWLERLDIIFTLLFTIEMIIKQVEYGFRNYWKDGWNRLDGSCYNIYTMIEIRKNKHSGLNFILSLLWSFLLLMLLLKLEKLL